MNSISKHFYFVLLLSSLLLCGCSVKQIALNQVSDAIASGGDTFSSDNDLKLVGDATPFSLKLIESLLSQNNEHRGLLLAATRGFTQYAYAYVQMHADELEDTDIIKAYTERERAKRLYLRARDYGLRGLSLEQPGFLELLRKDPQTTVKKFQQDDVALLYWTGIAWVSAISLGKDDPFLIADLPSVEALMRRAYDIDETFGNGSLHVFFISYEMSKRAMTENAIEIAHNHFNRAIELSNGTLAAPYVALAEAVYIPEQNKEKFLELLNQALGIEADKHEDSRLVNIVMQKRARFLISRVDNYFN